MALLIIPLNCQSLYWCLMLKDLHRFIESEMINFLVSKTLLIIFVVKKCIVYSTSAILSSAASVGGVLCQCQKVSTGLSTAP